MKVFLIELIKVILAIFPILISLAYLTLAERKVLAALQRRRGPNVVGWYGLLQPLADGLKLFLKESVIVYTANQGFFLLSPLITFGLSLLGWLVIPFNWGWVVSDISLGLLYIFAVSSLGVYGILLAGWSSNSRYAFLGSLRSAAQMVSYEVSLGLTVMNIAVCVGSFNLTDIVVFQQSVWFVIPLFPVFIMFFISALAETNRPPFDLPEAEAELVAGYNVEYSGMGFALFFLGEYSNIIFMSTLTVVLFFGGWWLPFISIPSAWNVLVFGFKICLILFLFIWVRGAFPRYRYDQLMRLGWKVLFPLSLGWLLFTVGILTLLNGLPPV